MSSYFENSYNVLYNIFKHKAYSTIELNEQLEKLANDQNKALITKIVYGVLESNLQLEFIIGQFAKKRPKLPVYLVLKMGVYASINLDSVPDYAIVNELVELTRKLNKKEQTGFVNKVLKRVLNKEYNLPSKENYLEYLSITHSYPLWLIEKLRKQYGLKVLEQLVNAKQNKLKHIRVNLNLTTLTKFEKLLENNNIKYKKSLLKNALFVDYRKLKNIKNINHLYTVQSIGSMLIVNSFELKQNSQILDVCSAPGGKACYLAEKNKNGQVTAFDLHPHRVELIKKYANRMRLNNVNAQVNDASILSLELKNKFDYVLCDVPCSGIGIVKKKPDILLFKEESSIKPLSDLQFNILSTSSNYVKVGGEVIYSTCTLLKEENEQVVNRFLDNNKNFELADINLPEINHIKINKTITLLPDNNNFEGYFIAKFKRIKK